jgi:hypothetical protein
MTLGDFRKITENYPDECSLQIRAENGYGGSTSDVVTRVIIATVDAVEEDESSLRPWIEVQA